MSMKQYECIICGAITEGDFKPVECPKCESELLNEVALMPILSITE